MVAQALRAEIARDDRWDGDAMDTVTCGCEAAAEELEGAYSHTVDPAIIHRHVCEPKDAEIERLKSLSGFASDHPRCPECCAELSACGEMTSDGPRMDCRQCQLHAEIERLRAMVIKLPKGKP